MIDLHTHTILSDGELLASELVRRAEVNGYTAIAITDHVDWSNIDFIVPHTVKVARRLNAHWKIRVIPGAEITHAPIGEIGPLIQFARENGAQLVVVHGETSSEPVLMGTNRMAIECGTDILAHPGNMTIKDAALAKERGVYLEITTRKGHQATNKQVAKVAVEAGAKMVLNTDTHKIGDMITVERAREVLSAAGLDKARSSEVLKNSHELLNRLLKQK